MVNHPNRSRRKAGYGHPSPDEIKALREKAGLAQPAAAQIAMTAFRTYQDWEHGLRPMPLANWAVMRLRLGAITLDDLAAH